jgi:hypothetical protein
MQSEIHGIEVGQSIAIFLGAVLRISLYLMVDSPFVRNGFCENFGSAAQPHGLQLASAPRTPIITPWTLTEMR